MGRVTRTGSSCYGRDICLLDDVNVGSPVVSLFYDLEDREFYGPYGDPVGSPEEVLPMWMWIAFRKGQKNMTINWHGRDICLHWPTDPYWPGHYDE